MQGLDQLEVLFGAVFRQLAIGQRLSDFGFEFETRFFASLLARVVLLLFTLAAVEVLFQIGFTRAQRGKQIAFLGLVHHHIGNDALGLDRLAAGCVVTAGGELEGGCRAVVHAKRRVQADCRLHRALAESLVAHDGGAFVVLQRAGNDFAGRGRTFVDEHHQWHALESALGDFL